ncbi:MAG TPA: C-GCAxxG-C-C family protein [Nitratidesulfovibrio sp.]|nr:C-GCAxxG-C-C family protein [Nitratidesulfovibrio sp.]
MEQMNRRTMLKAMGMLGCATGCLASGILPGAGLAPGPKPAMAAQNAAGGHFAQKDAPFSWKPHVLDAKVCAPVAYDGYWHQGYGCGYGVFYAIVGMMGEQHGAPYNQFPFTMLEVGKSGISDWGTICGALLGAASAFALFWGRKDRDPMVAELFRWYEQTALPMHDPGAAFKGVAGALPTSISHSPLCHVSVGRWCQASGFAEKSTERGERCARITADVATKAIAIMNAKQAGTFAVAHGDPASVTYCGECHNPGKQSPLLKGKMDCTPCHSGSPHTTDKFKNHP